MTRRYNQCQLTVPKGIWDISKIDPTKEIRLYVKEDVFFIDNPSDKHHNKECLGVVKLDPAHRFFIHRQIRRIYNLNSQTQFLCYLCEDVISFKIIR